MYVVFANSKFYRMFLSVYRSDQWRAYWNSCL